MKNQDWELVQCPLGSMTPCFIANPPFSSPSRSAVSQYAAAKPNINTLCMKTYVLDLSFVYLGDFIVQALNTAIQNVL